MSFPKTREPQYQCCLDLRKAHGEIGLGLMSGQGWIEDPKRLVFVLSRYKFVAKMLAGQANVLEVGCADAFGTRIVMKEVCRVTALDRPGVQRGASAVPCPETGRKYLVHDCSTARPQARPIPRLFPSTSSNTRPSDEIAFWATWRAMAAAACASSARPPKLSSTPPPEPGRHVNCKSLKIPGCLCSGTSATGFFSP
jgi:hypothetical protein